MAKLSNLPEDFRISEDVRQWATRKGFGRLDEHLEAFLDYARSSGKRYCDWDAAFRNAIRGNWAKLPCAPIEQKTMKIAENPLNIKVAEWTPMPLEVRQQIDALIKSKVVK